MPWFHILTKWDYVEEIIKKHLVNFKQRLKIRPNYLKIGFSNILLLVSFKYFTSGVSVWSLQ